MSKFFHKKRIGEITKHCEGKKVLDIGCAGNETDLYREISKVADEIVGIDINEDVVNDLKDEGFEVYAADAQDFELEDEFEVVVLGNIIGYIPNGGKVLENINKHLKEEGILVTSILNPFSLEKFWNFEISDKGNSRVCYYSPRMFRNLTSTYGFKEKKLNIS